MTSHRSQSAKNSFKASFETTVQSRGEVTESEPLKKGFVGGTKQPKLLKCKQKRVLSE
jgi:hypothetical protein